MKNFVKSLPQMRMGCMKISTFNIEVISIDNDGTSDGHCSTKGSLGSFFTDFFFEPGIKWGLK